MSDELIERMITDESGKKHKLDCIVELLQSEKLEERVAYLEEALKNNTWTLLPVPREAVIDYLINSSVYLDSK